MSWTGQFERTQLVGQFPKLNSAADVHNTQPKSLMRTMHSFCLIILSPVLQQREPRLCKKGAGSTGCLCLLSEGQNPTYVHT